MVDRFLSPPTILTHPLTLQSTIPPFFQHFLVFILASSGFTPFFDPPTAVKEQQRMQDVGSDSGDSSGYLRIPSSWHSAVDACTVVGDIEEGAAPLKIPCWSGLHAMDASKIKLALNIWWFYNGGFSWQVIWPALIMVFVDSPSPSKTTNPSN